MRGFGPKTTHIMAAYPRTFHRSAFRAARLQCLRLSLLDDTVFPRTLPFSTGQWLIWLMHRQ
jgi:hypothetical protein